MTRRPNRWTTTGKARPMRSLAMRRIWRWSKWTSLSEPSNRSSLSPPMMWAARSTRCWSKDRSMAASRRASAWRLMEEYLPGRTENLHDYLIPTIGDIPPIETIIIEEPDAHGPYGAKGLGRACPDPDRAGDPERDPRMRPACGSPGVPATPSRLRASNEGEIEMSGSRAKPEKIRCDACPVMCYIADGKSGACDRYANHGGELVRLDPLTIIETAAIRSWFRSLGRSAERTGTAISSRATALSSPPSARARPIRTTSPRRSSSVRKSTASTWSRS